MDKSDKRVEWYDKHFFRKKECPREDSNFRLLGAMWPQRDDLTTNRQGLELFSFYLTLMGRLHNVGDLFKYFNILCRLLVNPISRPHRMRKTSYVVTFLAVLCSLILVSSFSSFQREAYRALEYRVRFTFRLVRWWSRSCTTRTDQLLAGLLFIAKKSSTQRSLLLMDSPNVVNSK